MTNVNVSVMSPVNSFSNTEQRGFSGLADIIQVDSAEKAQATEVDSRFVQGVTDTAGINKKQNSIAQKESEEETIDVTADVVSELDEKLSSYAKSQVGLKFTQNDDPRCSVVSLVDMSTEEVIRQIPSEEILALRQRLNKFCSDLHETNDASVADSVLVDTHV